MSERLIQKVKSLIVPVISGRFLLLQQTKMRKSVADKNNFLKEIGNMLRK